MFQERKKPWSHKIIMVIFALLLLAGFFALLQAMLDMPVVYLETGTERVVGCSIDGSKVPAGSPACQSAVTGRYNVTWVKPGWKVK